LCCFCTPGNLSRWRWLGESRIRSGNELSREIMERKDVCRCFCRSLTEKHECRQYKAPPNTFHPNKRFIRNHERPLVVN
jgi:hypothetical protein